MKLKFFLVNFECPFSLSLSLSHEWYTKKRREEVLERVLERKKNSSRSDQEERELNLSMFCLEIGKGKKRIEPEKYLERFRTKEGEKLELEPNNRGRK